LRTPNNFQTDASAYGDQTETWHGIDLTINARLPGRVNLQGGLNSGTQGNNTNGCFVVDSPGGSGVGLPAGVAPSMRQCAIERPWQNSVKFLGSVELPYGINVGATFQRLPQPEILANYTVGAAQIASGIARFVNPARTSFSGGTATVALLDPGPKYLDYLYQVDLRFGKAFQFGRVRARVAVDVANLLNGNAIQRSNNTYGTSWLRPTYILEGRVIKPGFTLEF
jgi:hypothetical protein